MFNKKPQRNDEILLLLELLLDPKRFPWKELLLFLLPKESTRRKGKILKKNGGMVLPEKALLLFPLLNRFWGRVIWERKKRLVP